MAIQERKKSGLTTSLEGAWSGTCDPIATDGRRQINCNHHVRWQWPKTVGERISVTLLRPMFSDQKLDEVDIIERSGRAGSSTSTIDDRRDIKRIADENGPEAGSA